MARYIDADIVLPKIQYRERTYGCSNKIYSKVIKDTPTADVRPERHGKWVIDEELSNGYRICKCSVCGRGWSTKAALPEFVNDGGHFYCGSCGAKMDGKGGEQNAKSL